MSAREYIKGIFLLTSVLLVVLTLLPSRCVYGQQRMTGNLAGLQGQHAEKFAVFTDRNLYVVGEKILFSVFNLSDHALQDIGWSKVLYLELVSRENDPVVQEKFMLRSECTEGYLAIPQSMLTGTYYLRVYTRWMRNNGPEKYAYARIKVVNPYQSEVSNGGREILADTIGRISFPAIPDNGVDIRIEPDKKTYGQRSRVQLTYTVNGEESDKLAGLCLTVVREGAVDTRSGLVYHPDVSSAEGRNKVLYVPETRGMAVTGEVVEKAGQRPVPNARVQLSVLGDDPDYFGYITGEDGRFYIPIPDYTGLKDFYISAETTTPADFEVLIDKDFSGDYVDFRDDPFDLSARERSLAEEMVMNVQVQQAYGHSIPTTDTLFNVEQDPSSFYGEPLLTLRTNEFVKLPSLEEFIFELVPQVTVVRAGGKKELKVFGDYSDLSIYRPLILLDHVAISDLSSILAVTPEKIGHLDVINASYIRGSINYGGIISIFSSRHDLAGADLPDHAYFFGLKTLAIQDKISFPSYENDRGNRRDPDFRNTLAWIPDLARDENRIAGLDFYTSDKKGRYLIFIRGVTPDGKMVTGTSTIYVE